jgi:ABC-type amino acid transport system permease subunit
MPRQSGVRRTTTQSLSLALVVVGAAVVVRMAGIGNVLGVVLGILFVAAGAGRFYLARRTGA